MWHPQMLINFGFGASLALFDRNPPSRIVAHVFIIHYGASPNTTVDATRVELIIGPIETVIKGRWEGADGGSISRRVRAQKEFGGEKRYRASESKCGQGRVHVDA